MQHKRLANAIQKAGFTVDQNPRRADHFSAKNGDQVVSWFTTFSGEGATCVYMTRESTPDDLMTDYHAGIFARTIKEAVAHLAKAN